MLTVSSCHGLQYDLNFKCYKLMANNAYADESKTIKEASFHHILRPYFYIFLKGNI